MKKLIGLSLVIGLLMNGCASVPKPEYVSPNNYQSYDCSQLVIEYNRLTQYINANNHQNTGFSTTGIGLGVGIGRGGVYPNVSIGVGTGNGGNRSNLAIALGERDAIIQAGRLKQCSFVNNLKLYGER